MLETDVNAPGVQPAITANSGADAAKINGFVNRMAGNWRAQGYTQQQVAAELDSRLLFCAKQAVKRYLKATEAPGGVYTLTAFDYWALTFAYSVLRQYYECADYATVDRASHETEWRKWRLAVSGTKTSNLLKCVIALERLVEIEVLMQQTKQPYVFKKPSTTNA